MATVSESYELTSDEGLVLRGSVWCAAEAPSCPEMTFVHGAGLTVESYLPAFRTVIGRTRVFALNVRGHGGSEVPAAYADWDGPLADLRRLISTRVRLPVILAGHSFGALLSLRLAAEHPELAAGLLLLDPLVPWPRSETWPATGAGPDRELIERTRTRRARWANREEARDWLAERGIYRDWADEPFSRFLAAGLIGEAGGAVRLACPPWVEAATYAGRPDKVIFTWAEKVRVPAVILRGRESPESIGVEDLTDAFRVGALLTVRGGHTFPQERPAETGAALAMALDVLAGHRAHARETRDDSPPAP